MVLRICQSNGAKDRMEYFIEECRRETCARQGRYQDVDIIIGLQMGWQSLEEVFIKECLRQCGRIRGSKLERFFVVRRRKTEDGVLDAACSRDSDNIFILQRGRRPCQSSIVIREVYGLVRNVSIVSGAALGVAL